MIQLSIGVLVEDKIITRQLAGFLQDNKFDFRIRDDME